MVHIGRQDKVVFILYKLEKILVDRFWRIHKAIDVWRNMPDGTDKDQFLDRFVRDSCVNMAIIGTRFSCNTGKNVPDDMLKEIKRLGLSAW